MHTYSYVIPEMFRPKGNIFLSAQNLSVGVLGTANFVISPSGTISTVNDYPQVICSGMTMWNI